MKTSFSSKLIRLLLSGFCLFLSLHTFGQEKAKPKRIITLTPHTAELAFSAGLGNKLIAVGEASDYPEEAKALETVSNYQGVNLERIIALKPDLIIAWQEGPARSQLEKLDKFGIQVIWIEENKLSDIALNIQKLSQYADDPSTGITRANSYQESLDTFKAQNQAKPKLKYLYLLSESPMMSIAGKNWTTEMFELCGGENILHSDLVAYPQINKEQILKNPPDVIFYSFAEKLDVQNLNWGKMLPQSVLHNTYSLNPDWISRATSRTLSAINQICTDLDKARSTK